MTASCHIWHVIGNKLPNVIIHLINEISDSTSHICKFLTFSPHHTPVNYAQAQDTLLPEPQPGKGQRPGSGLCWDLNPTLQT